MLTSTLVRPEQDAVRPSFRTYDVSVARVQRLSPSFTRVTFTGGELAHFGTAGLDQRIKLVLPLPGFGLHHFPRCHDWYGQWRSLPEEHRNPLRTYTVRHTRPHLREVDVDFVTHDESDPGQAGPAARWLSTVVPGDQVALVGPDSGGENPRVGIEWNPVSAAAILLAGDETAAPAICAILAALPQNASGAAIIEVPQESDFLQTDAPPGVTVTWLARSHARAPDVPSADLPRHGALLNAAVRRWISGGDDPAPQPASSPAAPSVPGLYAWLAGEATMVTTLRRFLVSETGIDRRQVTFMGYWRAGATEPS
jgi:NADPH-dependent ferric siderophore reductase